MSGLITEYLGAGLASARPAAPTLSTGASGQYVATDTGIISVWNGSYWADVNGWNLITETGAPIRRATVTITIATPGVVTLNAHGFAANQAVVFRTTGALPTGLALNTTYYVRNPTANTFEVSATVGGASINTTGAQSGVHSAVKAASWVFSSAVASVNFTNLSPYSELLILMRSVTCSVSGLRSIRVSDDNGGSYYAGTAYAFIQEDGADSASSAISMHGTVTTAARSGMVGLKGINMFGTVKPFETINRTAFGGGVFIGSLNPINAFQILNTSGGNMTGGSIYVFAK